MAAFSWRLHWQNFKQKKVIADPIISLYDTMVYDREKVPSFEL